MNRAKWESHLDSLEIVFFSHYQVWYLNDTYLLNEMTLFLIFNSFVRFYAHVPATPTYVTVVGLESGEVQMLYLDSIGGGELQTGSLMYPSLFSSMWDTVGLGCTALTCADGQTESDS